MSFTGNLFLRISNSPNTGHEVLWMPDISVDMNEDGVIEAIGDVKLNIEETQKIINPYLAVNTDQDLSDMIERLIVDTSPNETSDESFWDRADKLLLMALCQYVKETYSKEQQCLYRVSALLHKQDDIKNIFKILEILNPDSEALKTFKEFLALSGKTIKSHILSSMNRLENYDPVNVSNCINTNAGISTTLYVKENSDSSCMMQYSVTIYPIKKTEDGYVFSVS